uniref:Moesin/ezrin/radixin homolog 1 n=1 Tax=Ditylenchus dipsaci TaxID=166011 RepID=A0A915EWW7_9BILA
MVSFFRSLSQRFRPSSKSRSATQSSATPPTPPAITSDGKFQPSGPSSASRTNFSATDCSAIPQDTFKKTALSTINEVVDSRKECQCKVLLLDGTYVSVVVPKKALGQAIYDKVFNLLDLDERDYFGLQYTDHYHVHHWLDPLKKINKQVPIGPPYTFRFRVKFYSSEPNNLREELTRYQFFLQLKSDIQTGLLECPKETATELGALALQSEFGDYNPLEHHEVFVSEFRFHPEQDEQMEVSIVDQYKLARGQSPAQAELNYLNKAKWLELYGVDNHIVEGKDGNEYKLGLTPTGMLVFDGQQKIGLFFWEKIQRLDFRNRKLTIVVEEDADQSNTGQIQLHTFVFELSSHKACKHLWKCAIEHHTFFRLKFHRPPKHATRQLFRLGSTFKYRGRTEYENVHKEATSSNNPHAQNQGTFERRPSQRYVPRQSHLQKQKFRQEVKQQVIASSQIGSRSTTITTNTNSSGYQSSNKTTTFQATDKIGQNMPSQPPAYIPEEKPIPMPITPIPNINTKNMNNSSSIPVFGGANKQLAGSATHITTIKIENGAKAKDVPEIGLKNVSGSSSSNNASVLLPSAYNAGNTRIPKYIVSLDNMTTSTTRSRSASPSGHTNIHTPVTLTNNGEQMVVAMNNNAVPTASTAGSSALDAQNNNNNGCAKEVKATKIPSIGSSKPLKSVLKKENINIGSNLPVLITSRQASNASKC